MEYKNMRKVTMAHKGMTNWEMGKISRGRKNIARYKKRSREKKSKKNKGSSKEYILTIFTDREK